VHKSVLFLARSLPVCLQQRNSCTVFLPFADNVNEYLKLAANADKQQVQRIKAVFEKKNQKSAQVISQLQKKLDTYQKRVHELETHGLVQSHRPPREVLRDMGQGLK
jgi:hypothetical protein